MTDDTSFDVMVAKNQWHDKETLLQSVHELLVLLATDWSWVGNSQCKYIDIRIDMRDGAYIILDRSSEKRISLEQVKEQG